MPFTPWRVNADLKPLQEELARLGSKLDHAVGVLEKLTESSSTHFAALPDIVVERAVAELREASHAMAAAAIASVRRHIIEEVVKWAWRAALAYGGAQLLFYVNQIATGLHK